MPEPVAAAALASAAVSLLSPYLAELAKSGAGKLGEAAAGGVGKLWGRLTARLTGPAAAEAVADAAAAPQDALARASLELQLRKALDADPDFRAEVAALVADAKGSARGVNQTAIQSGNGIQILAEGGSVVTTGGVGRTT